jgi:hypothetical protein
VWNWGHITRTDLRDSLTIRRDRTVDVNYCFLKMYAGLIRYVRSKIRIGMYSMKQSSDYHITIRPVIQRDTKMFRFQKRSTHGNNFREKV